MFEIGFAELFLLGVIALLVVGPDRLPALARTVGVWVGRAQRLVGQVRADIEREVRADELRKAAKEYSPTGMLGDMRKEVEDFASEVSTPVDLDAEKAEAEKAGSGAADTGKAEVPSTGKASAESGTGEASGAAADGPEDAASAVTPAEEPVPGGSGAHVQAADEPEADGTDTPDEPGAELAEEAPATETDHDEPESADTPPAERDERSAAA